MAVSTLTVSILPKQQVQITSLVTSRSMPLGVYDTDIDEWIKAHELDDLTYDSADQLIQYLTMLPVSRTTSQAHLPMSSTSILVNTKKGKCVLCNEDVLAGLGLYVFNAGGWDTFHTSADCPQVHELPLINWNCVALMESLEMFIVGLPRTPKVIEVCEELLALSTAHTASLPFDLALPLMEFQKAGVSYALKARRTLLCDAMGLGKSCQAIAVAIDVKLRTCMVRRRKEDVLSDLPPKRRAQIDVELSASEMATYRKAEDDFLLWVFNNYGKDAWQRASKAEIITRMNKLREILGIAKIRSVVEHVKSLLSEDEQVVVFAYHRKVIEGIKEALKDYGVVVVAGGSTPEQKEERVEKFMKGEAKVFIGQYQSAGSGLNLTCASNVVLAEMTYTPAEGQQAEDRCHRIGQPNPIVAWWITAVDTKKPTMDMRMWALLNQKSQVTSATMDGWAENLNADAGTMTAQLLQDMLQEY